MTDSTIVGTVLHGQVKKFEPDRKFGFIKQESGPDLFFHLNNGAQASEVNGEIVFSGKPTGAPTVGTTLIFKIGQGSKGPAAMPWALASDLDQASTSPRPVTALKASTANRQKIDKGIVFETKGDEHRYAVARKDDTEFDWRMGLPTAALLSQYPMLRGYKALVKVLGQKMTQLRRDIKSYADFLHNEPVIDLDENGNGTFTSLGFTMQVEAGHLTLNPPTVGGVNVTELCQHAALMTLIQINVINPRLGFFQPWIEGRNGLDAICWHVERRLRNTLNTLVQVLYAYSYLTNPEVKERLAAIGNDVRAGIQETDLMWTSLEGHPVCFTGTETPNTVARTTRLTFLEFPFSHNLNWQKPAPIEPDELTVHIAPSSHVVTDDIWNNVAPWESYLVTYRYQIAEIIGFDEWPEMATAFGLA